MAATVRGLLVLALVAGSCLSLPQGGQLSQADYDYLYEDLVSTPNFEQPVPQAPILESRPRSRQQAEAQAASRGPAPARQAPQAPSGRASELVDGETTTFIPILKNSQSTDPVTGAFIYDYMGGDGSGKYEVRFKNGTVIGNFTYINDQGERETRWYSAGVRGTEIEGDGVISPAPPTFVDETTGANYVDLSNYDLYRHLEVPYVHEAGPSDPNERDQLTRPGTERSSQDIRSQQRPQQAPVQQFRESQPSQVPLDFGDEARFTAEEPQQTQQRPSRVSRTRVRVADAPAPPQATQVQFDHGAVDSRSPNHVLDSLINQFQ